MTANDNFLRSSEGVQSVNILDPIAAKMAALREIASGAVMQARALLGKMSDAEIRVLAAMAEWDVQRVGAAYVNSILLTASSTSSVSTGSNLTEPLTILSVPTSANRGIKL